jgi:radical SAM superfamily enzyme YgiQ (UPF0313 family)
MASILLIYPEPEQDKDPRFGFSLNLLYLGSILKYADHKIINYLDFSLEHYSPDELNSNIAKSDFIIFELDAFSLKRSSNINHAELLIANIKKKFPAKVIIAFGYDLALFPRKVAFAAFNISSDIIESKILKIIDGSNIDYNYNINTESFDKLPFPARSLLSNFIEYGGNNSHPANLAKSTLIQTSRGCLNSCTFCQRKGWQKKFIAHSVDYVVSEFRYLQKQNYKNVWITDDNFTFNLNRSKKILKRLIDYNISENMKISCSSWSKIDKEFLDLAESANISIISFGIESTNSEILDFYNKKIELEEIQYLINYADKIGLYTIGNFIIGAPMETKRTIENTFEYALDTAFDQVNIKTLDYMAGAELFEKLPMETKRNKRHLFACKENGLNNFRLSELREEANNFRNKFIMLREKKLDYKMKLFGIPYKMQNYT